MKISTPNKNGWGLYQFPPSFVLGFHGCDREVAELVLGENDEHLKVSENDYDWLGAGIYFWESNPQRALEWAQARMVGKMGGFGYIKKPCVLGAIIRMGHCLNMCDSSSLMELREANEDLVGYADQGLITLPVNDKKKKMNRLDCVTFEWLHAKRRIAEQQEAADAEPYDTVRATYQEGKPIYEGTDFLHQDHTQICVRNKASILGYFRPIITK